MTEVVIKLKIDFSKYDYDKSMHDQLVKDIQESLQRDEIDSTIKWCISNLYRNRDKLEVGDVFEAFGGTYIVDEISPGDNAIVRCLTSKEKPFPLTRRAFVRLIRKGNGEPLSSNLNQKK